MLLNKFSSSVSQEVYRKWYGEHAYWFYKLGGWLDSSSSIGELKVIGDCFGFPLVQFVIGVKKKKKKKKKLCHPIDQSYTTQNENYLRLGCLHFPMLLMVCLFLL